VPQEIGCGLERFGVVPVRFATLEAQRGTFGHGEKGPGGRDHPRTALNYIRRLVEGKGFEPSASGVRFRAGPQVVTTPAAQVQENAAFALSPSWAGSLAFGSRSRTEGGQRCQGCPEPQPHPECALVYPSPWSSILVDVLGARAVPVDIQVAWITARFTGAREQARARPCGSDG